MSAYDNDPHVHRMSADRFEVDGRWFLMETKVGWCAWDLSDRYANGAPVGGYGAATPTADDKIRELIGEAY
jgi:hypothetical protein